MKEDSAKPHNDCRNRLSAFSVVYLAAFAVTIISVLKDSRPVFREFASVATSGFQPGKAGSNMTLILVFEYLLLVVFCFHLVRVYISLEMMEADHGYFKEYLENLGTWKRYGEFFLRLAIIVVVSLKVVSIFPDLHFTKLTKFRDLAIFMAVVYTVFLAWDVSMFFFRGKWGKENKVFLGCTISTPMFRGKWEKKYAIPDVLGLAGALSLVWVGWDDSQQAENFGLLLILVVFVEILIGYNLYLNFSREGGVYRDHFLAKLRWLSGDRKCPAPVNPADDPIRSLLPPLPPPG